MTPKKIDYPPSLGQIVKAAREKAGLSLRDLADACGGTPTSSTIWAIEQDRTSPNRATLEALAKSLRVRQALLLEAAGRAGHNLGPFVLPPEAAELTVGERKVVLDMVSALLAARRR